ncbi:MAG: hypothetical protein LBQ05_00180 [Christensenellaceae bacterium]|nr:hypothetical protein [Christensenellaceae bacterium]
MMLLLFELKKIVRRISLFGILGFIIVTAMISVAITLLFFNDKPENISYRTQYAELTAQLDIGTWNAHRPTQSAIKFSLDEFHTAYKQLNTVASINGTDSPLYIAAKNSATQKFTIIKEEFENLEPEYWLIFTGDLQKLTAATEILTDFYITGEISLAQMNTEWETLKLSSIIDNMVVQELSSAQLYELNELTTRLNDSDDGGNAYINCAYRLLYNSYALELDENTARNLAEYTGFNEYNHNAAVAAVTLNEYLLANNLYDSSAHPFTFGDIYNGNNTVSLFDFIFTNLEIVGVPLVIITIIFMSCAFFTDIYTHTIIETVASRRRRISVIISKIFAVWVATFCVILGLIAIYVTVGILFTDATVGADIVALFNNDTPLVWTPANYFALYLLSLLFKLSVLMLSAGLFSLSRVRPSIIVGLSLLIAMAILLANALLGGIIFYQYIPILALEPIKYFGATLFMSQMPTAFNILYTFPILGAVVVVGFFQIVYNFSKRDF